MSCNTAGAVRALGADGDPRRRGRLAGDGRGRRELASAARVLDFGNSGTGSRLMMGAVATTPITAIFTGDASLRSRPMARVLDPLTRFGMRYEGAGPKGADAGDASSAPRDAEAIDLRRERGLGPGEIGAAAGGAQCAGHKPHHAKAC